MAHNKQKYNLEATYGKQSVPVFKIRKHGTNHSITDMQIQILLEGDVEDSWLTGDNHQILPTETQKNTCYVMALKNNFDCLEDYGNALAHDILDRYSHIKRIRLEMTERTWHRVMVGGKPHNHAFVTSGDPIFKSCKMDVAKHMTKITSGICNIKLMKTAMSGFDGFIQDKYGNLKPVGPGSEAPERIMCTDMVAEWTFSGVPAKGYRKTNEEIVSTLTDTFAGPPDKGVFSKSLQETAYKMATAVLDKFVSVNEVFLATPNVHFYTYPMEFSSGKIDNPNIVFQATDCQKNASGRIVTRLKRNSSKL
eukprot:m.35341 g.35341  ORF g.35341 m.35341 type:complete len:308 (+) comp8873_c0_seq2:192-1115(+)